MIVSELIGLRITELRYDYTYQNEYNLQEFYAYLKLSSDLVIEIPQFADHEIKESEELNQLFKNASKPSRDFKESLIINQNIVDIHFCLYDQEPDYDEKAYLELENGIYLSEVNFGPMGVTNVDLKILNQSQFEQLKDSLSEKSEIRSYLKDLQRN